MIKAAVKAGLSDRMPILYHFPGEKQPFGCNVITDGIAGFFFERMHQIIFAQIKMF